MSLSTMDSLDMILRIRLRQVDINVLQLRLPMLATRTGHVALRVDKDAPEGIPIGGEETVQTEEPAAHASVYGDLLVYYLEEARRPLLHPLSEPPSETTQQEQKPGPRLGDRGVRADDVRGQLHQRRVGELLRAEKEHARRDRSMWVALRRDFITAEQFATDNFKNTVVFEPFGGNFGVTRCAASSYSWTCSQPMDIVDGYDILKGPGKSLCDRVLREHRPYLVLLAFDCRIWSPLNNLNVSPHLQQARREVGRLTLKRVVAWCLHQHRAGRYYLVENPGGSLAWTFDGILARLLDEGGGKFVMNDQCAYGKVDKESGRPVRKTTGWISNSKMLLNSIGKRCTCPAGAHEPILGSNRFGVRSKQAAEYPLPLCKAICQGLRETMVLDYAFAFAKGHYNYYEHAFPVLEGEETEESGAEEEPTEDFWRVEDDRIVRVHRLPRQLLFLPLSTTAPPVPLDRLTKHSRTRMLLQDGTRREVNDEWWNTRRAVMDFVWTGETEFFFTEHAEAPEHAATQQNPNKKNGIQTNHQANEKDSNSTSQRCLTTQRS